MKLAVFSDAHQNIELMETALQELEDIDYLLYAGDGLDKIVASQIPEQFNLIAVRGNCDYGVDFPLEKVIDIAGIKIFLTHGNRHRIKQGLNQLYYQAREEEADVIIFGHTHCRYAKQVNGLLFFNPGSISNPRDNQPPSYGLLKIEESDIEYEHCQLSNSEK
ncbi:MAG: metallophosphoesterase family protein [Bacillota bacterium]